MFYSFESRNKGTVFLAGIHQFCKELNGWFWNFYSKHFLRKYQRGGWLHGLGGLGGFKRVFAEMH
jgi:hypothetical protein